MDSQTISQPPLDATKVENYFSSQNVRDFTNQQAMQGAPNPVDPVQFKQQTDRTMIAAYMAIKTQNNLDDVLKNYDQFKDAIIGKGATDEQAWQNISNKENQYKPVVQSDDTFGNALNGFWKSTALNIRPLVWKNAALIASSINKSQTWSKLDSASEGGDIPDGITQSDIDNYKTLKAAYNASTGEDRDTATQKFGDFVSGVASRQNTFANEFAQGLNKLTDNTIAYYNAKLNTGTEVEKSTTAYQTYSTLMAVGSAALGASSVKLLGAAAGLGDVGTLSPQIASAFGLQSAGEHFTQRLEAAGGAEKMTPQNVVQTDIGSALIGVSTAVIASGEANGILKPFALDGQVTAAAAARPLVLGTALDIGKTMVRTQGEMWALQAAGTLASSVEGEHVTWGDFLPTAQTFMQGLLLGGIGSASHVLTNIANNSSYGFARMPDGSMATLPEAIATKRAGISDDMLAGAARTPEELNTLKQYFAGDQTAKDKVAEMMGFGKKTDGSIISTHDVGAGKISFVLGKDGKMSIADENGITLTDNPDTVAKIKAKLESASQDPAAINSLTKAKDDAANMQRPSVDPTNPNTHDSNVAKAWDKHSEIVESQKLDPQSIRKKNLAATIVLQHRAGTKGTWLENFPLDANDEKSLTEGLKKAGYSDEQIKKIHTGYLMDEHTGLVNDQLRGQRRNVVLDLKNTPKKRAIDNHAVFVNETLKDPATLRLALDKGGAKKSTINRERVTQDVTVQRQTKETQGGYPDVESSAEGTTHGKVMWLNDDALRALDKSETKYQRVPIHDLNGNLIWEFVKKEEVDKFTHQMSPLERIVNEHNGISDESTSPVKASDPIDLIEELHNQAKDVEANKVEPNYLHVRNKLTSYWLNQMKQLSPKMYDHFFSKNAIRAKNELNRVAPIESASVMLNELDGDKAWREAWIKQDVEGLTKIVEAKYGSDGLRMWNDTLETTPSSNGKDKTPFIPIRAHDFHGLLNEIGEALTPDEDKASYIGHLIDEGMPEDQAKAHVKNQCGAVLWDSIFSDWKKANPDESVFL